MQLIPGPHPPPPAATAIAPAPAGRWPIRWPGHRPPVALGSGRPVRPIARWRAATICGR